MKARPIVLWFGAVCAALSVGCADQETDTQPETTSTTTTTPEEIPYAKLSTYGFFEGKMSDLAPSDGVFVFEVASPLWSDNAGKQRFIALPRDPVTGEAAKIAFDSGENWQFPKGTIVGKTFFFYNDLGHPDAGRRILETRLLILEDTGWSVHVYRWNDDETEATRIVSGENVDLTYTLEDGTTVNEKYIVPNTNQCKSCHERDDEVYLLGPFTHQMNRDIEVAGAAKNQLTHMAELGMFDADLPDPSTLPAFEDPFGTGPLEARARSYLHANCGHCHRPGGGGGPSGLVLLAWETDLAKNGACKPPAAAGPGTGGHLYDIVPGKPEESIIVFRMSSTDPEVKMPELPNRLPDQKGIALISEWITAMDPVDCTAPQ